MRTLTLLIAAVVVACGSPSPSPSPDALVLARCQDGTTTAPRPSPPDDQVPAEDALAARGLFAFCAQLEVQGLNGPRTIQVGAVANRDTDPLSGRRVLVYHPGGPGISAVQSLFAGPPAVDFDTATVVAWDGATASSSPGSCGPESTDYATERDPFNPAGAAGIGAECRSAFGAESDPSAVVAAQELEAIRLALGVEDVDLLMASYGTAIGEAYLRASPGTVRHAVLDGPLALEVEWQERVAAVADAIDTVAASFVEHCVATCDPELAQLATDGGYAAIRAAILAEAPPVGSGSAVLTGTMLDQATLLALREPGSWDDYLRALGQALGGDGTPVWTVAERQFFSLDRSAYYSSLCRDLRHPATDAAYRTSDQRPLLAAFVSDLAPCLGIDQGPLPDPAEPGTEAGPAVLVVASTSDVQTPLGLVDHADWLGAWPACATSVVGHTSYGDDEVRDIMVDFLRTGDAGRATAACDALTSP